MLLNELFAEINILKSNVDFNIDITHIANDHRKVCEGTLFVAIKGGKRDGNDYIESALQNGAALIVTDDSNVCKGEIPYVLVENSRSAIAILWSNYYHNPSKYIKTVAITGTNGKTSSAYFLYNILLVSKVSCGLISTIECSINGERIITDGGGSVVDIYSAMTTPDPEKLYHIYNIMKEKGVRIAVIEASSHALSQKRLDGIKVAIGAFTNLSSEHLDYHDSIEEYFNSKEKLFEKSEMCVANIDDIYGQRIFEKYKGKVYSCGADREADFSFQNHKLDSCGVSYDFVYKNKKIEIASNIVGMFTVYNTLIAASCAKLLGIEDELVCKGISATKGICGRMEQYKDMPIYIDYAHTPRAMEETIKGMRRIEPEKHLIVLFGCGGDRDREKRAIMGKISTDLADFTVITSDNPRTENPRDIIRDIVSGIEKKEGYAIIPSRREAIKIISKSLNENDILLLLGKGHEEYEITDSGKHYFSEKEILDEVFSS